MTQNSFEYSRRCAGEPKARNSKFDNYRTILIFLVVFGHLLNCFPGRVKLWLYLIICSFHMPAFVYLTGYFAKFDPEKTIKRTLYPYVIYQFLYLIFQRYILGQENTIQFTEPYWLLWYLFSSCCWHLLIPVIDWSGFQKKWVIAATWILALFVGYDSSAGYHLSLSRTVVLFPFFVLGHYRCLDQLLLLEKKKRRSIIVICILIIGISICVIGTNLTVIQKKWFYHAEPYSAVGSSALIRLTIFIVALAWCALFMFLIPDRKIPVLTSIGTRTLPIFLLHGFVVKWLTRCSFFQWSENMNLVVAFMLAVLVCVCFGNRIVERWLRWTFVLGWKYR